MAFLDWRYTGREKDHIELSADLAEGWRYLEKKGRYWGFDEAISLPSKTEPEYWCRLYVVALEPVSSESVHAFPGTVCCCGLGHNSVSISGSRIVVDIPLSNSWQPTKDKGRPGIYEIGDPLFSITTPDGAIKYRLQLWFVNLDPRRMPIKPEYERGDRFALVGGRPESNRRKF